MPDQAALAGGVASMHALGASLWSQLGNGDGNLAISPFSVAVALGMTANGAGGPTLDEMLDVLAVDSRRGGERRLQRGHPARRVAGGAGR